LKAELALAAARAVNRVLTGYPKAMQRLAHHAGKRCRFEAGPGSIELRVTSVGAAEPVGERVSGDPEVVFMIPAASLPTFLRDREAAMQSATFAGDSEFAQLIAELARELRWEAEEDLSRVIGDIGAHRVANAMQRAGAWQRDARSRLIDNAAEYLTEENRAFLTRSDFENFTRGIEDLRDAVARLEARLQILAPSGASTAHSPSLQSNTNP
jgi:ubiquinone biosynthesis protein UbiJ